MIFSTSNDDGKPAWQSVLDGTKIVTRRIRPVKVGSIQCIQPKRTEAGICECGGRAIDHQERGSEGNHHSHQYKPARIRIVSCELDVDWCDKHIPREHQQEAKREGFRKWENLGKVLKKTNPKEKPLYRIQFERMI